MKTKFQPQLLGIDQVSKAKYESNLSALIKHLSDYFNEVEKHIIIENKSDYKQNLLKTFCDKWELQHRHKFPEMLSLEKCLELSEVNIDKLRFLSGRIGQLTTEIDIDFDTLEVNKIDFGIYTESLIQNEILYLLNDLIKNIESAKKYKSPIYPSDLLRAFSGMLIFDHSTQMIKPNIQFIKSK
jgi:hypothetical protein